MRAVTWVVLVGLALAAVASGNLRVAFALAACKALLVGFEFMELRHTHRLHLAGYAAFIVGLTTVLVLL